ncbi:MAG: hypothetical protein ACLU8W_11710 [Clostridia bacterium]
MKTRRWKRTLSVVLAGAMVITSLSAALTAWAADDDVVEPERDPAVVAVEEQIKGFYDTHRNNLYKNDTDGKGDDAAEAEAKAAARKAFNETSAAVKSLSEEQKLEVTMSNYVYWLYTVGDDVARSHNADPLANVNAGDRIDVTVNRLSEITAVAGALPQAYQAVYDAFKSATTTVAYSVTGEDGETANYYLQDNAKVVYKDNPVAEKLLKDLNTAVQGFDLVQLSFAGFLYPGKYAQTGDAGFYFYATSPTAGRGINDSIQNIAYYNFFMQQDLLGSGDSPASSFPYKDYVVRSGTSGAYTYAWAEGQSAQTYIDGFKTYADSLWNDRVKPSKAVLNIILPVLEKFDEYQGLTNAINLLLAASDDYYAGDPDVDAIQTAVDTCNVLSETARAMFDRIGRYMSTNLVFGVTVENEYTNATALTPETAYTAYSKASARSLYYVEKDLSDALTQLQLEAFIEDVNAADLDTLTGEQIEEFRTRYLALGEFKEDVPADTFAKFSKMVKPEVGEDTFADDLASFAPHAIDKTALKGSVVDVYGGVQYSVDKLWGMVASLLPSIAPDVDLSNGLGGLLEQYLYTDSIVEAIFDLYATLSHNEMDLGIMGLTLGDVISMVISPSKLAGMLEEEKFAGAVEKIKAIPAVTDEEEAQGINELDKLAAIDFTDADFGFTNGDRAGFVDALLAALRPITTILEPNATIIIIKLGVQMCDYINANGEYITGVYGNLIPLLEQLGMNVPTTEEYAKNYNDVLAATGSKNIAADEYLRPVIDALFEDVVDPIAADPLNALIDFLPRLAHVVEDSIAVENEDGSVSYTNILDTQVKAAIAQMGGTLGGLAGSLDLTEDAINAMIPDEISIPLNETTNLTLKLADIDWDMLADCATLSVVPSNSNANAYTLLRTGEAETVFTELFYYLYTALFGDPAADGGAQLNATIAAVKQLLGEDMSGLIDMMVTPMLANGKEDAYVNILQLVAGDYQSNVIDQTVTINAGGEVLLAGDKLTSGTIKAMNGIALDYMIRATDTDYAIGSVAVGGEPVAEAADQMYYLLNAAAASNQAVDVSFLYDGNYNVTVKVGENGSADAESMSVHAGTTVEITFTADEGYVIDTLTVNGEAVEAAAGEKTYVWTAGVYGDMVVEAAFAEEPTETDPTEPTDPTDSTEPTDPIGPTEPSEPTEPTDPSEPATDGDSTQAPDTTAPAGEGGTQGEDSNVATGDAALAAVAGAALLAVGAVIVLAKKRK